MIPAAFDYRRATSLDDALSAISGGDAKVAGRAQPATADEVAVGRARHAHRHRATERAEGVRQLDDGRIAIGAMTTYAELLDSPAQHYGLLSDAVPRIGDIQVRNRGTVGGSIAHADPASDLPACLLALDAELVARSTSGERTLRSTASWKARSRPASGADELLIEDPPARAPRRRGFGVRLAGEPGVGLRHRRRRRGRVPWRRGWHRIGQRRDHRRR